MHEHEPHIMFDVCKYMDSRLPYYVPYSGDQPMLIPRPLVFAHLFYKFCRYFDCHSYYYEPCYERTHYGMVEYPNKCRLGLCYFYPHCRDSMYSTPKRHSRQSHCTSPRNLPDPFPYGSDKYSDSSIHH